MTLTKDPDKVRAGALGARKRWGRHTPAVVKIGDLSPEQRHLVVTLIRAARQAREETGDVAG